MSSTVILLILAVVLGIAYFAKRNHRKQQELKRQTSRR
jgi:preprotein translocase subunit YajC